MNNAYRTASVVLLGFTILACTPLAIWMLFFSSGASGLEEGFILSLFAAVFGGGPLALFALITGYIGFFGKSGDRAVSMAKIWEVTSRMTVGGIFAIILVAVIIFSLVWF